MYCAEEMIETGYSARPVFVFLEKLEQDWQRVVDSFDPLWCSRGTAVSTSLYTDKLKQVGNSNF
ncbi:MAG: hypothetical protein HFH66_08480 [Lachnospiraceae bacterium]|jgi:hypothetical protein|nr:hypothetical protein [Lachnospiraceae bacterium]